MIGYLSIGVKNAVLFEGMNFTLNGRSLGIIHPNVPIRLSIPSRNKEVYVFGGEELASCIRTIDSSAGNSYQEKLSASVIRDQLGIVVNTGEHPGFATTGRFHYFGLTSYETTFLVFTTDPEMVNVIREQEPGRYLIYRFGETKNPVFAQVEQTVKKWPRWVRTHGQLLAFNALESRLYK